MPSNNQGKNFENVVRKSFLKVSDISVDRIPDQMSRYKGSSSNICDFVVYKWPYLYYIECKSVHGNTLPFSNIRDNQWDGLLEKSQIYGVRAGVICWYIDHNVTTYIPIGVLNAKKFMECKSIRYDDSQQIIIPGKKKRVFYDYDMQQFFNELRG